MPHLSRAANLPTHLTASPSAFASPNGNRTPAFSGRSSGSIQVSGTGSHVPAAPRVSRSPRAQSASPRKRSTRGRAPPVSSPRVAKDQADPERGSDSLLRPAQVVPRPFSPTDRTGCPRREALVSPRDRLFAFPVSIPIRERPRGLERLADADRQEDQTHEPGPRFRAAAVLLLDQAPAPWAVLLPLALSGPRSSDKPR